MRHYTQTIVYRYNSLSQYNYSEIPIMKYTLRQLEVFLATARQENLSRAADNLSMSQSAASGALKELENQFDIQLFDRVGKRLQLNDFGRLLQPLAEELLARAQELEVALGKHQTIGQINVGATLSIGNYMTIPLINLYRQKFPQGKINLEVSNTETIAHKVANFELDVGLIEGEVNNPALIITPWREDELSIFCSKDHPYVKQSKISTKDLITANWILREEGSGTRQTFNRIMHDLIPKLNILLELEHTEAIKAAVESNMGLSCLSSMTLKTDFEHGRLVPLQAQKRSFKRRLYLIIHKDKYQSAAIQHWIKLCLDSAIQNE